MQEGLNGHRDVPRSGGPGATTVACAVGVQVLEPQAANVLGHVLQPEEVRLIPMHGQPCGGVLFRRV